MRRTKAGGHWAGLLPLLVALCTACGASTPTDVPTGSPSASPGSTDPAGAAPTIGSPVAPPTGSPVAPLIPDPPHAAALPPGSIDEQAVALAAAVAPGGQAALAPLLTAYHAAGLPVIGSEGQSLVGDPEDPVGLPYWMVWLSAGSKPDFRLSLADSMKLLVAMEDAPDVDTAALADVLLLDLREMAGDDDPQRRFFGRFLAAMAAQGGVDPLAADATPDDVLLNAMSVTYLMAAVLRGIVTNVVAADPDSFAARARPIAAIGPFEPPPPRSSVSQSASPCNFTGIPEQIVFWTQFIASRIAGGVQTVGMKDPTTSLVSLFVGRTRGQQIGNYAGWVGSVLSALGLVIQLAHIDVDILLEPEPLERTKSSRQDGQQSTLTAKVFFDLQGSSLDGGQGVGNCLLLLLTGLGIQTSLPSDGPIPGATVIFEGKAGFNQGLGTGGFVQFANFNQMRQDTDANGEVQIEVQGIHQRRDKASWAPEWMREASVHIHSTTGAVNERNLAQAFINGLTANPAGAIGAIADALATVRWDVGERVFRVKDWLEAWYIDQQGSSGVAMSRIVGQKCDGADGKWQPKGEYSGLDAESNGQVWDIDITMNSATSGQGTFTYSDVQIMKPIPGVVVTTVGTANGTVTISINADTGVATLSLQETKHTYVATTNLGGQGSEVNAPLQSYTQVWQPGDPNNECDPPPP